MDRNKDHVSLDHLARVLADIHQDSSQILDSVISNYQRDLLQMMFHGDASSRDKYSLCPFFSVSPIPINLPADSRRS
jgi:WD repeat-containing protein 35